MTKAQQLGITKFPYVERDANGNKTYIEDADGWWCKREFDDNGNVTYVEYSYGFWEKYEYDDKGNVTYYETSNGIIKDNRPKTIDYNNLSETLEKMSDVVSNILVAKRLIEISESNIKMINGNFPDLKQEQEENIKKYNQIIAKLEAKYKQLRNKL